MHLNVPLLVSRRTARLSRMRSSVDGFTTRYKDANIKRRIVIALPLGVPCLLAITRHDNRVKEIPCKDYMRLRDVYFLFHLPEVCQREFHRFEHHGSQLEHRAIFHVTEFVLVIHIVSSLYKNSTKTDMR